MATACSVRVRGVVQGVGFRPFVYRLAQAHMLSGWVLNGERGVEIHLEGTEEELAAFVEEMRDRPPAAAQIAEIEIEPAPWEGLSAFTIRESERLGRPTVRVSPDLPVCEECLAELFDPSDRRFGYPYINCTNCGPRYSVILALPYDRPNTTMRKWPMDRYCCEEYHDPGNRRFHAQPVACPECGPSYFLLEGMATISDGAGAIARAAQLLREGKIVAVKGIGGYHLACDARNAGANAALRERKYRKEKPFAVMARDLTAANSLIHMSPDTEALLLSAARPIVLDRARVELDGVAPGNEELGVMLPYTPLQHLIFAAGAPDALVMTSANRSSEPIAYGEDDALERLAGIADAFLIGERPIARRVDDSVARVGVFGPMILRRSRGYAPGAVAVLPTQQPVLAVGADLKNTITLVVNGEAFVSQHIGDLEHYQAFRAFEETVNDLISMYDVPWEDLLVAHDCHPQYAFDDACPHLTGGSPVRGAASSGAPGVGACRAWRLGGDRCRGQPGWHRVWRRRKYLGWRDFCRQHGEWLRAGGPSSPGGVGRRRCRGAISRCRRRRAFCRSSTIFRTWLHRRFTSAHDM